MTLSASQTGALLEQLYGVLVDELKFPLKTYDRCTATGKSIHDGLDTLVADYPDFAPRFIKETREWNKNDRECKWSTKTTLNRLNGLLYDFLERVEREESPQSSQSLSEGSTEFEFTGEAVGNRIEKNLILPSQEDEIIVISDDDLESLAPDSPTYQRYLDIGSSFRVKSEIRSEASHTGRTPNQHEEQEDHGKDGEEGQEAADDTEVSDAPYASDDGHSSSGSSYATAFNSPIKRKLSEEDAMTGSPIRTRSRLEGLESPETQSTIFSAASSLALPPTLPSTPFARPELHSGASNAIDKLRLETRKFQDTPTPLSQETVSPMNLSAGSDRPNFAGDRSRMIQWDPEHPIPAPSAIDEYVELAAKNPYQAALNCKVNYYVQWEVERQVQAMDDGGLSWGDFQLDDIDRLTGAAAEVIPRIPSLIRLVADRQISPHRVKGDAHMVPSPAVCSEMDLEEKSIRAGDLRGLGNEDPAWAYGGKLVFAVTVLYKQGTTRPMQRGSGSSRSSLSAYKRSLPIGGLANPFAAHGNPFGVNEWPFTFKLCQVDQPGKSTRLARRFGSRRILTIRFGQVPQHARRDLFFMLRGRALVLFGRVFRVLFIAPDSNSAVAVESNEEPPHYPPRDREALEPPMPSFLDMLQRYNSLGAHPFQSMAKWASRLQLLLSNSIPGLSVGYDSIAVDRDIVCASASNQDDPDTAEILSDGCGLMSEDLARRLLQQPTFAHLESRPFSIQMRIGGAKGVLCIMSPTQQALYPGKDIVLRPSMIKSLPEEEFKRDPSLYVLDVLKVDPMKVGSNLSSEAIVIMAHNGVPMETILDMAQMKLDEIKHMFFPSQHTHMGETEQDMAERLVYATYRFGGVGSERRKREMIARGKSAKVAGLVNGHFSTNDDDEGQKPEEASMAEKLYDLLQAGFKPSVDVNGEGASVSPEGCAYAVTKLRALVRQLSNKAASDLSIPVSQSATAFIVPDTLGVLAPNEAFVSFASEEPLDPVSRRRMPMLEGDVLLFRSPSKLPTDVRKLKAVIKPELFHLRDCIVLSANSALCTASPASFLGGGDYDGDTATIIWDQSLVQPFTNAPEALAAQPAGFASNFAKQVTTVDEFLDAVDDEHLSNSKMITNLQHFLLGSLLDDKLTGVYSDLHTNSVYTRGCDHPESLRLAHMFCSVLDARKSGLSVPRPIRAADQRNNPGQVRWRNIKKGRDDTQHNVVYAKRPEAMGPFIMDEFISIVSLKQKEILASFPEPTCLGVSEGDFSEFTGPYDRIVAQRHNCRLTIHDAAFGKQINTLAKHVTTCSLLYSHIWNKQDTTPISELYRLLMTDGKLPVFPNTNRGVKDDSKLKAQRTLELALVWRDGLMAEELPLVIPRGREDHLAELKVSCAVYEHLKKNRKRTPVKMPFELDLQTMCDLKARLAGLTRTVPAHVAARLRPSFSYTLPPP